KGALISAQTEVGTYTSDSQHIRDLIRREQARSADIEATRLALMKASPAGRLVHSA
ncbi:hypothetical protein ALQ88_01747, partial [Pseudomonas savastanoi]